MALARPQFVTIVASAIAASASLAHAADPVLLHNWQAVDLNGAAALYGFRFAPPDTMGAVGVNHFVELINGAFTVYDKNGTQLLQKSDKQFFTDAGFLGTTGGDPRIQYDPNTSRWFASELTTNVSTHNQIVIAVSQTSDPTGPWKAVNFTGNVGFADYPHLGIDANAVYVGTNNFSSSTGFFTGVSMFTIPKTSLTAGTPTTTGMTAFENLNYVTYGFTGQPISDSAIVKVGSQMVAAQYDTSQLIFTPINGTGAAGATLGTPVTISVSSALNPPAAIQPIASNTIDALDNRIGGTVYQVGNLIYLAHTVDNGGRAAVRWDIVNATTHAIVQEGTIAEAGADIFMGSIAANEFGEVVIGYSRSNGTAPAGYASAFAIGGTTTGGALTFGSPILLHQGEDQWLQFLEPDNSARWGDYSAVTVDPADHHTFWTVEEYAETRNPNGDSDWGTQIAALQFQGVGSGVPEPATLSLLALGASTILIRRKKIG